MPVVPTMNQQQVQPEPFQAAYPHLTPHDAFGADVAGANEGVNKEVSNYGLMLQQNAVKMQQQKDTSAVLNADTQFRQDLQNTLSDPQNGLLNTKLSQSQGITPVYDIEAQNLQKKYASQMNSSFMQQKFNELSNEAILQHRGNVISHEAQQTNLGNQKSLDDNIQQRVQDSFGNLGIGGLSLLNAQLSKLSPQIQSLYGYTPQEAQFAMQKYFSSAAVEHAKNLIDAGNYQGAQQILSVFKNQMSPNDYLAVNGVVSKLQRQDKVNSMAQDIINRYTLQDGTNRINLAAAENEINGIKKTVSVPGQPSNDQYYAVAQQVSQQTGIPANLIYGQMYHESGGFTSQLATENNNLGGITQTEPNGEGNKQPDGSNYYMSFDSPQAYGNYLANYLNKYVPNAKDAKTPEEFAHVLKDAGYYTADEGDYAAGIKNGIQHIGDIGSTSTTQDVPDYDLIKQVKQQVHAAYVDRETQYNKQQEDFRKNIATQLNQTDNATDAYSILNNVKGSLSIDTYNALDNAIKSKFTRLASGNVTPEQKFYARYERDGLYKDQDTIQMLQDKYADAGELTDSDWKRWNDVHYRYDRYMNWSTNGAYGEQQQQQQQHANEGQIWTAIEDLTEKGLGKQEIIDKINQIAPSYGFDPNYFINNADWAHLGKNPGGVK